MNTKVEIVTAQLAQVNLKPGDKLVVMLDKWVNDQTLNHIIEAVRECFGKDVPVIFLDDYIKLAIVRAEDTKDVIDLNKH